VARRIIIAVIITLAALGVARRVSMRRPADIEIARDGVRVHHRMVTEQVGPGTPPIIVDVEPPGGAEVFAEVGRSAAGGFHRVPLEHAGGGRFETRFPDLGMGARVRYAITVETSGGDSIRLPDNHEKFFLVKFKGAASKVVLVLHILFMFASFFFMVLALFGAIRILRGLEGKRSTVAAARWVLFLSFVGGWPLGFLLNYQTFGVLWEGYPFGSDITDSKTQVMFVFWLVSLLLVRGSLMGRGEESDRINARAFAWAIVTSFIVSLALFVLPHSI
jgi:hypothetical protein